MIWRKDERECPMARAARHPLAGVVALAAGAGAMYLLDPAGAPRRRRKNDRAMLAGVRSALAGAVADLSALRATLSGGIVTLRGRVPLSQVDGLLRAVYAVEGVRDITNRLSEIPDDVPDPAVPRQFDAAEVTEVVSVG